MNNEDEDLSRLKCKDIDDKNSYLSSKRINNDHFKKIEQQSLYIALKENLQSENLTFKQHLDMFLANKNRRDIIESLSAFFSFFTFTVYIASTYDTEDAFKWFNYLDCFICFYFILELMINIYLAQHRCLYLSTAETILNIFTSIVPYLFFINGLIIKKLIELSRILRIIKLTRCMSRKMKNNQNEVGKHISMMILSAFTLILIFTLVYRIAEIDQINYYIIHPDNSYSVHLIDKSRFHDFLYFIVVTLSTVGYGDIYPLTEQGRVIIILLILLALILIPKQTNELIKLMSTSSIFARAIYKSNPEVPHIVICGNVGVDSLKNFCNELFHPDHGTQDKNVVIMQNSLPNQEMKVFLYAGKYEVSLKYLQGNPIIEKDLCRIDILNSKACVIMTNKYSDDPHKMDHYNILLSLAIKKYFLYHNKNSALFIQLIKPENKIHFQSGMQSLSKTHFNDQVVIIEEIKMNLLSKSCVIPGIITMTSNLVMSAGSQSEEEDFLWIEEYKEGRGHEIYRTLLNNSFKNKTFSKLSSEIYQEYEAIVFALEIEIQGKTIISLNPGTFNIEKLISERDDVKLYIYIICSDKAVADRVRTFNI